MGSFSHSRDKFAFSPNLILLFSPLSAIDQTFNECPPITAVIARVKLIRQNVLGRSLTLKISLSINDYNILLITNK